MKSLQESIFDKDLVTSYPWGELDEWMNGKDDSLFINPYIPIIQYIMSDNPKCPYPQYDWDVKLSEFPKNLRAQIKHLKEVYISVQKKSPSTILFFDADNKYDIYADSDEYEDLSDMETTPLDDVADDIGHIAYTYEDEVARFGKLDKHWAGAIKDYNNYYSIPMPDFNCPHWVAIVDETCLYMIGFPNNTPKDVLKLFRVK